MALQTNKYFKIKTIGSEAILISESLLKSYPLTKACLKIFGKSLLEKLEFGFFSPGNKIIIEGEKGKDLFLVCNHSVDVFVSNQKILQMPTPALLGDKAIIDRNSTRNATISIADGNDCLVLKIPLGIYLKSSKASDISDDGFKKERQVYSSLFDEVQTRLFHYSDLQNNLWEEANGKLNLLNIRLITNILGKQKEQNWNEEVWNYLKKYLIENHQYQWPKQVKITVKSFNTVLRKLLLQKFQQDTQNKFHESITTQKRITYKNWLDTISTELRKIIPVDQLPVSIGELEMFNPQNYRIRMKKLLRSIQSEFLLKKLKLNPELFDVDKLKSSLFFKKKVNDHEFDLHGYLKIVKQMFIMKNSNRVLSYIAQQIAQLAASCENEFNTSVSKLQQFLDKISKMSAGDAFFESEEEKTIKKTNNNIQLVDSSLGEYLKKRVSNPKFFMGEILIDEDKTPPLNTILGQTSSIQEQNELKNAINELFEQFKLKTKEISTPTLLNLFYLCRGYRNDAILQKQFSNHYWIPISEGMTLNMGENEYGHVKPGMIIGGEIWKIKDEKDKSEDEFWFLLLSQQNQKLPKSKGSLVLILPKENLPWEKNKNPSEDEFVKDHLPLLQWFINKYIEQISWLILIRNGLFKLYSQTLEIINTEKKVREFENSDDNLKDPQYRVVASIFKSTLGIPLSLKKRISSKQLSKQIYLQILSQTKADYSSLEAEEQENKTYTLWRFIQSEIVHALYIKDSLDEILKFDSPSLVFSNIKKEAQDILGFTIKSSNKNISLTDDSAFIDLKRVLNSSFSQQREEYLPIGLKIMVLFEKWHQRLFEETSSMRKRLKKLKEIDTEFNIKDIQSRFLAENISKLEDIIHQKINPQNQSEANPTT